MFPPSTSAITSSHLPPAEILALSSFFASQERLILLDKRSSLQSLSSSSTISSDDSFPSPTPSPKVSCGLKRKRSDVDDDDEDNYSTENSHGQSAISNIHEGEVVLLGGMKMLEAGDVLHKVLTPSPRQCQYGQFSTMNTMTHPPSHVSKEYVTDIETRMSQ